MHFLMYQVVDAVGDGETGGRLAAVEWVVGGGQAPVTHRPDVATWEQARAESWVTLCVAAQASAPTGRDWARLGVSPRPAVVEEGSGGARPPEAGRRRRRESRRAESDKW